MSAFDLTQPKWMADGLCHQRNHPADLNFFATNISTLQQPTSGQQRAVAYCTGTYYADGDPCPVLTECDEYATQHNISFGVWGGKTEQQRNTERKNR